ncbi:GTPase-activating protein GYP7, partial [Lachnellula suecica]
LVPFEGAYTSTNFPPSQRTSGIVTMTSSSGPARAASPSNSFYALSDDEEGEYNTITHTTSGKGVKLLYSKSKAELTPLQVYIHPTPSSKDNIAGYIALLQQKPAPDSRPTSSSSANSRVKAASSLLLAWLPESSLGDALNTYVKVDLSDGDEPPKQSYLVPPPPTTTSHPGSIGHYAFAIPVSAIYSLLVRPPSIGWWFGSLIINSRAGDSFPALFFHDSECQSTILQKKKHARNNFDPFGANGEMFWGGDEVLRWLKRYVEIERSGAEPNIYLIEPSAEDKEAFGGKPVTAAIVRKPSSPGSSGAALGGAAGSNTAFGPRSPRDAAMDPVMKFVKETGWNLMEKFSKVTTFTRRTADSVIDNPKVPPQVRRLLKNPEVQVLQDEFDSARIYLARWAMGIAEQGERDRAQRIWTARDVLEMEETDVGDFELLDTEIAGLSLKELRKTVTMKEWKSYFDPSTGRLQVTADEVKERIFHGGLDADDGVRKEAWLFLLGIYDWDSSADDRKAELASLRDEYVKLKGSWWDRLVDLGGEGEEGEWWREQKGRIEKDVHRTDRQIPLFAGEDTPHPDPSSPFADVGTNVHLEQMKDMLLTYNEYNRDLGYVQGMSDLLAPIYAVTQDDAIAFWGFQHFMDRMERNFLRDQSGMRKQLLTLDHLVQLMDPKLYLHLQSTDSTNFFFFFRMLLVWFKREFQWLDILHLWEVLWTDYLSSNFHLFIALAILEKHRDVIMEHLKHFDEVLKYVNELSTTIDLESTLIRAEALFRRFQRTVEAIDKKSNFPAPKLRQRKSTAPASPKAPSPKAPSPKAPSPKAPSPKTPSSTANTSSVDAVSAGGTNSSAPTSTTQAQGPDKGKGKRNSNDGSELEEQKPKIISPELRELMSRKVEILPRKVVRKEGEGLSSLKK